MSLPLQSGALKKGSTPNESPVSRQLSSNMVASEFGEVNVHDLPGKRTVDFTILMEPSGESSEGWQTGVAIDGSGSMLSSYGRAFVPGPGAPPMDSTLRSSLITKGLANKKMIDGKENVVPTKEGIAELRRLGYGESPNEVEPLARDFTAYLASKLDADGGTTVIYWACGTGAEYEVLGDFTSKQCESAKFNGPSHAVGFGRATHLVPAMKYFVDRFADAKNGMYIFITDGKIDDMEKVKAYTISLCQQIEAKTRNELKFVLIGIGNQIDEDQMSELDDLDSNTSVDLWDHKIAKEMRQLAEIFAELVSENQIVAPSGKIVDAEGNVVKMMSDGIPAKIKFEISQTSKSFALVIGEDQILQQLPPYTKS
jgi:hypothetical protein